MGEIGFDPQSRVGNLSRDMVQEDLGSGGTEEAFFRESNIGYAPSKFSTVPKNDLTKLEAGELFERAYRFSKYHPFLAQYGYPLYFGMNDYNLATADDADASREIDAVAREILETAATMPELVKGTDAYVMRLLREGYDWSMARMAFKPDCPVERPSWGALKEGCGACTEQSAALYDLYGRLGLDRQFLLVYRHEPTIDNFSRFVPGIGEQRVYSLHVLVGIRLPESGRLVQVDSTQRLFDPHYPYATPMTPRQFTVAAMQNEIADLVRGDQLDKAGRLTEACLEMADNEAGCYHLKLDLALIRMRRGLPVDVEGTEAMARRVFAATEDDEMTVALLKIPFALVGGLMGERIDDIADGLAVIPQVMEDVEHRSPDEAAALMMFLAADLLQIAFALAGARRAPPPHLSYDLESVFERITEASLKLIIRAIELDPSLMPAYGVLNALQEMTGDYKQGYALFQRLASAHPELPLAHYLTAQYGLTYASMFPRGKAAPLIEEAKREVEVLSHLDPSGAGQALLRARLALYEKDYDGALRILESVKKVNEGKLGLDHYLYLTSIFLAEGKFDKAMEQLHRMADLDSHGARQTLLREFGLSLRGAAFTLPGEQEKAGRVADLSNAKPFEFMEKGLDFIGEDAELRPSLPPLYGILYAIALADNRPEVMRRLVKKIGNPFPSEVWKEMDRFMAKAAAAKEGRAISELAELESAARQKLDRIARALPGIFSPIATFPGAARYLTFVAKVNIATGDVAGAKALMREAFGHSMASSFYHEMVVKEYYADASRNWGDLPRLTRFLDAAEVALAADAASSRTLFVALRDGLAYALSKRVDGLLPAALVARVEALLKRVDEKLSASEAQERR